MDHRHIGSRSVHCEFHDATPTIDLNPTTDCKVTVDQSIFVHRFVAFMRETYDSKAGLTGLFPAVELSLQCLSTQ
jgi:hypothetical protein